METEKAIQLVDDRMCYGRGQWSRHHQPEHDMYWEAGQAAIAALKKQERDRWIPVSKALPEDYTDVLVWFEYFRYGSYNCMYQTYGIGTHFARYDSWMINHESGWHKLRVIAWKPLEPYREDEA